MEKTPDSYVGKMHIIPQQKHGKTAQKNTMLSGEYCNPEDPISK